MTVSHVIEMTDYKILVLCQAPLYCHKCKSDLSSMQILLNKVLCIQYAALRNCIECQDLQLLNLLPTLQANPLDYKLTNPRAYWHQESKTAVTRAIRSEMSPAIASVAVRPSGPMKNKKKRLSRLPVEEKRKRRPRAMKREQFEKNLVQLERCVAEFVWPPS